MKVEEGVSKGCPKRNEMGLVDVDCMEETLLCFFVDERIVFFLCEMFGADEDDACVDGVTAIPFDGVNLEMLGSTDEIVL